MVAKEHAEYVDEMIRVRYSETDQMGVAYYANYLAWFEVGRTSFCRAHGFTYADMEQTTETFFPVVEARCKYLRSVSYDDELIIRTRVKAFHRWMVSFSYEVLDREGQILHAVGETKHVFTGKDGRAKSLPPEYRAYFK
jgi:acyl-CoA thioester hydrolase